MPSDRQERTCGTRNQAQSKYSRMPNCLSISAWSSGAFICEAPCDIKPMSTKNFCAPPTPPSSRFVRTTRLGCAYSLKCFRFKRLQPSPYMQGTPFSGFSGHKSEDCPEEETASSDFLFVSSSDSSSDTSVVSPLEAEHSASSTCCVVTPHVACGWGLSGLARLAPAIVALQAGNSFRLGAGVKALPVLRGALGVGGTFKAGRWVGAVAFAFIWETKLYTSCDMAAFRAALPPLGVGAVAGAQLWCDGVSASLLATTLVSLPSVSLFSLSATAAASGRLTWVATSADRFTAPLAAPVSAERSSSSSSSGRLICALTVASSAHRTKHKLPTHFQYGLCKLAPGILHLASFDGSAGQLLCRLHRGPHPGQCGVGHMHASFCFTARCAGI
mmetsp:Transcript_4406/g.14219  ORF Transcript_4406/g.14219 Transcript_4406/m.14219 type:complete len:387 (-) Transcript_4406:728-1888(-)